MKRWKAILCIGLAGALLGCAAPVSSRVPEAEVAPTAVLTEAPTAQPTPVPTLVPTLEPTEEPTPTPTPDPLCRTWTMQDGAFRWTLASDGTYRAVYGDSEAAGTYTAEDGLLRLTRSDGETDAVPYAESGTALTLYYSGKSALALVPEGDATETEPTAVHVEQMTDEAPVIAYAYARGGVVTVELGEGMRATAYCFTCLDTAPAADSVDWTKTDGRVFETFKYDGTYNIFVRDEQGRVSEPYPIRVDSGYRYIIRAEGLTSLRSPLSNVVEKAGSSVDTLNDAITADIMRAGFYTRTGVVTAGVSTVSHLAELGYSVPYQGRGSYQREKDWGLNPNWGAKLSSPTTDGNGTYYYTGMQCVGAITWAYKQAGVNLSNGNTGWVIGECGQVAKQNDNKIAYNTARSGDLVQQNGHYLMVVDRLDTDGDGQEDSYLTYEMEAPHLTFLIMKFTTLRYRTFFSMDAVFRNEGRNRKHARFWDDTFFIPTEAMPERMQNAVACSETDRALDRLMRGVGLIAAEESVFTE